MLKEKREFMTDKPQIVKNSQILSVLLGEIIAGSMGVIGLIYLFLKIRAEVFEKELTQFDMHILYFLYAQRNPYLNNFMLWITGFGSNIMIIIWILLIIFLVIKKYHREAALLGFVLGMTAIINTALKILIQRPRPQFHPLVVENSYSFPSGHAMDSFVFYMTLVYLIYHLTKNKVLTAVACIFASCLVLTIGISRVYLGVHYPTDIIGGYTAGLCWMIIVYLIHQSIIYFRLFRHTKG
jgi:undecaprenyl-diphosphatase